MIRSQQKRLKRLLVLLRLRHGALQPRLCQRRINLDDLNGAGGDGKTAPRSRKYDPMNILRYYRCTGADGYRFNGKAVCNNSPVRADQLEQVVWEQVRALLEEPRRVADEYHRRIAQARDGAATPDEIVRLDRQMTSLRRGIGRLIDSYAEGIIDKTEFEPRIAGLKQRVSELQMRHQAALEATCGTSFAPSYAGSKSTPATSK